MKLSIFTTITRPDIRGDRFDIAEKSYDFADELIVIDGHGTWPIEFSWPLIGEHFQNGYERSTGDWVVHADVDFIFHEQDYESIRKVCEQNPDAPALSFWKYQFTRPDRYTLKSRLVLAVNKGKYGDRIRFDSGGDLCQPSLDGKYIQPDDVPEARVPFFNYEKLWKTEDQIRDDVERMARAWHRHFGDYTLGTDETAYAEWLKMAVGRASKDQEVVALSFHPEVAHDALKGIQPDQWGYDGFGNFQRSQYA